MLQRLRVGSATNANDDVTTTRRKAPHSNNGNRGRDEKRKRILSTLEQIIQMFRLLTRTLQSGILFMSYDFLPMKTQPTDENWSDPNLDHRLAAAINQ